MPKRTPMMDQYLKIKAEHPEAILFFHLGDFYEAFFEDAETLSRELDVVLTARNGNPMAGVPIRSGEAYVQQLLKRGYKVAICRQVEDPKQATGLVKREVVRVVTPGTALDEATLTADRNNYLCAVLPREGRYGLAALDLSTGEFACTEAPDLPGLRGEIGRLSPSEILFPEGVRDPTADEVKGPTITHVDGASFDASRLSPTGFGQPETALRAAAAVLAYVERTQKGRVDHIRPLRGYALSEQMDLDPFTVSSLEVVKPLREGQERGTLLHVLDRTVTSMGRRRLRRTLLAPLTDRGRIEARLDAIDALVTREIEQQELQALIGEVHDLERLVGKLGARRMSPPDLLRLERSLVGIPAIAERLGRVLAKEPEVPSLLAALRSTLSDPRLVELAGVLDGMLVDQPPVDARDGGMIRRGHDARLDALHEEVRAVRSQISALEQREREVTGIPTLKAGYNRVFGYYLEVTRPHLSKVPDGYRRRQTLANAERFVIEELSQCEERIAAAEERAVALEVELFESVLTRLSGEIPRLQGVADALSRLDLLVALAVTAGRQRYVRPRFTDRHEIRILGGRHPVVERVEEFVPNDLVLEETIDLVILTGPNMSGKSVYLRQAALISLMAQCGSFVPASEAVLPIVDRIFARVGASDMLVEGISTFMMEMLETATILERSTPRSLIILDEMGRGTSTFDGVSIAWAVAKELATRVRAKTLFATHYQELTRLADELPAVINRHVGVKEIGKEVVFLHRVELGTASGSYGIHVARLAGLPDRVTETADRILEELLEEAPLSALGAREPQVEALPLFGAEEHPVLKELRRIDPERMTPIEALALLAKLRDAL